MRSTDSQSLRRFRPAWASVALSEDPASRVGRGRAGTAAATRAQLAERNWRSTAASARCGPPGGTRPGAGHQPGKPRGLRVLARPLRNHAELPLPDSEAALVAGMAKRAGQRPRAHKAAVALDRSYRFASV